MKSPAALTLFVLSVWLFPSYAQVSVTTNRNDNSRSGQNTAETILTPASVNVGQFGKLFSQTVDGHVYTQPLYLPNVRIPGKGRHNVVYVATEHDSLYAFDADSNTGSNASALWQRSFIDPAKGIVPLFIGDVGCNDITPEIGITSTPVIDAGTGTIYVLVRTKEVGVFVQRLHALDVATGREKFGGAVVIRAKFHGTGDGSNNGVIRFDSLRQNQRAALLLEHGNVYIAWAAHCDLGPYHAWVMSYDASTLVQTGVWNSTPNGGLGGIWQSGIGLASDAHSNTFFATGNGTFDVNTQGSDFGDSLVKLGPPSANRLRALDYFTPFDQDNLNRGDIDLGSGGVLLLPDQPPGAPHKRLLVQVGKEGSIYLIDRDQMGHYNSHDNSQIVQNLEQVIGGVWGGPAWWNDTVYFGGTGDYLTMFPFDPSTGLLSTTSASESPTFFGYPGPTPSISANGTANGIVWAVQTDQGANGTAVLHAYDATNLSKELYNSAQNAPRDNAGSPVKFSVPTIANGKVYVPATGQLSVFGLLAGDESMRIGGK